MLFLITMFGAEYAKDADSAIIRLIIVAHIDFRTPKVSRAKPLFRQMHFIFFLLIDLTVKSSGLSCFRNNFARVCCYSFSVI